VSLGKYAASTFIMVSHGMHKGTFQNLQEKLSRRILMWDQPSQDGKEILIKTNAQAIPAYLMGFFKLPI
jgi:hypothetical protein